MDLKNEVINDIKINKEVYEIPCHLKRFKEGTISRKEFLKVVAIFILLRISSFFQIRITLVSAQLCLLKNIVLKRFSFFGYIQVIKISVF